jgi:hypothetical protein
VVKRRSLDDALSPDENAFLKSGTSKPKATPRAKPKSQPQKKEQRPMSASPALKENFSDIPAPAHSQNRSPTGHSLAGTGAINARIDPGITTALLRASLDRRIDGQTPWTQREIIAEALSDWLRKHGHLN